MTIFELAERDEDAHSLLHNGTVSHQDVASSLGVSEKAVRRYRKKEGIVREPLRVHLNTEAPEGPELYDVDDVPERDIETENADLRARNARLYKSLVAEKGKAQRLITAVYQASRDSADNLPRPKPTPRPRVDRRTAKQEEIALVHATDWQRSKVTDTYDSSICDERVGAFSEKVDEITDIHRAHHPVKHGVVLFTGDMLEGCKIFPGQEWEVDATLFDQLFGVAYLMEWFIKEMLAIFESIDVVGEWGNHGRIGRPSDGWKKSDNFDRIAYQIVKNNLRHETRIKNFKVGSEFYQHHEIGNYSFMAIHGDEIKAFGGNTPSYGILRKANAWAGGVVPNFRDVYMGHYHQSMQLQMANGGSVFMTGSTESDNEYAQEFVAASSDPSQRLNFINPERGIVTAEFRIWL